MPRSILPTFSLAMLTACATHSHTVVINPAIKRIAIIPASNPTWFSFQNAAPPVGYPFQFWVNKLDSKSKAKIFNEGLHSPAITLGDDVTEEVATALRSYGYAVEILQGLRRPADSPDTVDYDKIATDADAILHLWIDEVGVYSSAMSTLYVPRVNVVGEMWLKGREDTLYNEEIYYGVDARKGKAWAIVPDPKYAYPTFDAVMANIENVRTAFATGASEISKRMSEQIYIVAK